MTDRRTTPENERLGAAIRALRVERHVSQTALAEKSGTDSGHMSLIEQGKVGCPEPRLTRIAAVLGVEAWEIHRRAAAIQLAPKRRRHSRSLARRTS